MNGSTTVRSCLLFCAVVVIGCHDDCAPLPCPPPGWNPETCECQTPVTGPGAAGSSPGASFKPGDCTHPDWLDLKICCGKPGELSGSNCVPPSLVDHACSLEGEFQDVKAYSVCCKGLTPVARTTTITDPSVLDGYRCTEQFDLDPSRVCTQCGDKLCGTGENACNCPDDCS